MKPLYRLLKNGMAVLLALGLGFCVWVNLANAPGRGEIEAANRNAAEQVIAALVSYQEAQGKYPESLDALVPDHLEGLPTLKPADGQLGYEVLNAGGDFVVSYAEAPMGTLPADTEHRYLGSTQLWEHKVY